MCPLSINFVMCIQGAMMSNEQNFRERVINLPNPDSRRKTWGAVASSAIALAATSTALAQEDTSASLLDEIIVTANRTESELSKTPVAVSVIGGNEFRDCQSIAPTVCK
jgi:hypothetical protein